MRHRRWITREAAQKLAATAIWHYATAFSRHGLDAMRLHPTITAFDKLFVIIFNIARDAIHVAGAIAQR